MSTPPSTTAVSDALDLLGIDGVLAGCRAVVDGARCAGPAFTVSFRPVTGPDEGAAADYLESVPAGAVVVLDNGGRSDCTVWGDLLTRAARRAGVSGTVVWGAVRDVATSRALGYPLFSAARLPRSGKGRVVRADVGCPVTVAGVRIAPGDVVVADDDGVVAVPAASWPRVRELAGRVAAVEDRIAADVDAGAHLADARRRHGYHDLRLGGRP